MYLLQEYLCVTQLVVKNVESSLRREVRNLLELIIRVTFGQGLIGDILIQIQGGGGVIVVSFWRVCISGRREEVRIQCFRGLIRDFLTYSQLKSQSVSRP